VAPPIPLGDPTLDAAVRYFGKHGLRSTALDDVARSGDLDVREVSRRYPSSRCLAAGIFERMLDILGEQLDQQSKGGVALSERLQRWFELELQLLEPCKALVRSWLIDLVNPLSPAGLLQGPLAFRYAVRIQRELELARSRGEISAWVSPAFAAGAFIGLRRSLVLGWLGDDSPAAARTLSLARAEIAAFVSLLAPWPGLDDAGRSHSRSIPVREPRALPAASAPAHPASEALSLPVAAARLPEQPAAAARPLGAPVEAAEPSAVERPVTLETEPVPPAAVSAAMAQAPAILGPLAQTAAGAEPLVSLAPEAASRPESPLFDPDPPAPLAPVKPGSEKSVARSKRRSRTKRSKH
jgi:hypothetical protein